jgi:hypothetical protein
MRVCSFVFSLCRFVCAQASKSTHIGPVTRENHDYKSLVFKVLFACMLVGCFLQPVTAQTAPGAKVLVSQPATNVVSSPVHFVASATTGCNNGVSAMGIYTAPGKLAYVVNGAKLDTDLTLSVGNYDTVVQEWDNCGGAASTDVPLTVIANPDVSSPIGKLTLSPVHYVATAITTCAKGVAAIGIYTAPGKQAYVTPGSKLDTLLTLSPGTYDTVVQEWDNCGGAESTDVPVTVQQATTTLAAETSNNTSAADSFLSQTNGNEGSTNVSKVDIRTLLYPGATTEIYAELQPWFGDERHMDVGYTSWDPVQVEKQLEDMQSRGVTGVVIDWYGPADTTEPTTLAWLAAAEAHPGFKVMIMIDKGAVTISACKGCNAQQTMIYLTNYILKHYATSSAYAMFGGNPIITQFDLDLHFTLDWNAIQAGTSKNIAWIFEHADGFTHALASGSWSWVSTTAGDYGMPYLDNFYNTALLYPKEQAWGGVYKGFNDTLASWGAGRIVTQQCGGTWLETFSELNKFYDSGQQLPILQLVTWNDYEEGTEIETGIDNCLSVSASIKKSTLSWTVTGHTSRLDHYIVYFSQDDKNLLQLDTVSIGSFSIDLSAFDLDHGTIYVQAIGKPTIKNQMSGAVAY